MDAEKFEELVYCIERSKVLKEQKTIFTLFDFVMVIITGGLWLLWIIIKFLRRRPK